jgi:hypothetical protein
VGWHTEPKAKIFFLKRQKTYRIVLDFFKIGNAGATPSTKKVDLLQTTFYLLLKQQTI